MEQKPFTRSIVRTGDGSLGASLPRGLLRQHGIEAGDEVEIDADIDDGTVTFHLD